MENSQSTTIDNKSCKIYFLLNDAKVYFTGDFDSGNLEKVQQLSPFTYRVTPGFDKMSHSSKKAFFYFRAFGFKKCRVKLKITRMYLLEHFIKSDESSNVYHPVSRRSLQGPFQKIKKGVSIYYNYYGEPQLSFYFQFENEDQVVEFAFTYPYSYQDNQKLLSQLYQKYSLHPQIYFRQEVLCKTKRGRNVDIINITDLKNCQEETLQKLLESARPFKINKPVVVISARVHPGQTTSSYCVEGVLKFLLNAEDKRSALLRKNFHFIIIPMINPDGVYEGMFRFGLNGLNLNRLYQNCNQKECLEIWSIVDYVNSLQRVDFFFDLHSHPSNKPFFIYGNSFQTFIEQVEAQLFGKFLQFNCPFFQNLQSIFTQKAMKSKQKYDSYGKQGCARVFYHKKFNIIHSYTVECGYFAPSKLRDIQKYQKFSDFDKEWQVCSFEEYQPQNYMFLGKSLLISILDLFQINPSPKIPLNDPNFVKNVRKEIAQKIYFQNQRFKLLQLGNYKKIREITELISQKYYKPRFQKYGLRISYIIVPKDNLQVMNGIKFGKIKKKMLAKSNNFHQKLRSVTQDGEQKDQEINAFTGRTSNEISKSQKCIQITESIQLQSHSEKKSDIQTIHQRILNSFSKYQKKPKPKQQMIKTNKIDINTRKLKTVSKQKNNSEKTMGISTNSSTEKNKVEQNNDSNNQRYAQNETIKKMIKSKLGVSAKEFLKFKKAPSKEQESPRNSLIRSNIQLPSLKNLSLMNSRLKLKTTHI